jgi:hypothetical protein
MPNLTRPQPGDTWLLTCSDGDGDTVDATVTVSAVTPMTLGRTRLTADRPVGRSGRRPTCPRVEWTVNGAGEATEGTHAIDTHHLGCETW